MSAGGACRMDVKYVCGCMCEHLCQNRYLFTFEQPWFLWTVIRMPHGAIVNYIHTELLNDTPSGTERRTEPCEFKQTQTKKTQKKTWSCINVQHNFHIIQQTSNSTGCYTSDGLTSAGSGYSFYWRLEQPRSPCRGSCHSLANLQPKSGGATFYRIVFRLGSCNA